MTNTEPTFANFFSLFDQPISFKIDSVKLNTRLRQLQRQFHPDKSDESLPPNSQKNSALINHAYNILVNPDSRANYLLELSGQEMDMNASISDLGFLDDAMDMRINLDDAAHSSNLSAIKSLQVNLDERLHKQSTRFEAAYQSKDWPVAIDATQKLRFLVKLKKDMDIAIDDLHQQSDNDDDIYL